MTKSEMLKRIKKLEDAIVYNLGHTPQCMRRIVYGDGYCECKRVWDKNATARGAWCDAQDNH